MTHTPPPTQDDLAAGRELDAEVATRVFGYVAWAVPRHSGAHAGDVVWLMQPRDAILAPPPDLPSYSTDISAAWTVVEFILTTKHYYVRLDVRSYGALVDIGAGGDPSHGEAETVPLAICRAALKAISAQP